MFWGPAKTALALWAWAEEQARSKTPANIRIVGTVLEMGMPP
jgi:hypothetical protein